MGPGRSSPRVPAFVSPAASSRRAVRRGSRPEWGVLDMPPWRAFPPPKGPLTERRRGAEVPASLPRLARAQCQGDPPGSTSLSMALSRICDRPRPFPTSTSRTPASIVGRIAAAAGSAHGRAVRPPGRATSGRVRGDQGSHVRGATGGGPVQADSSMMWSRARWSQPGLTGIDGGRALGGHRVSPPVARPAHSLASSRRPEAPGRIRRSIIRPGRRCRWTNCPTAPRLAPLPARSSSSCVFVGVGAHLWVDPQTRAQRPWFHPRPALFRCQHKGRAGPGTSCGAAVRSHRRRHCRRLWLAARI